MGNINTKRVSMGEISERLGVSAMTVSRMLNAKSPPARADALKTYNQIRQLAYKLGYRKSAAPRAMITGKYHAITILGSTQWRKNHMPQTRLFGLQEAAGEHSLALNFSRLDDESLISEEMIPDILQNFVSDGLLVNYVSGYPKSLDEILRRYHIPAIWMNSKHTYDCIYLDDFAASQQATEYLLSLGHRRIGYWLLESQDHVADIHYSTTDRHLGYVQAMKQASVPVMEMASKNKISYSDYGLFLDHWLRKKNRPTAIMTYNPPQAMAAMVAALRRGLRVPEDLSIMTFHDEPGIYQFTSMKIPEVGLGIQAIDLLVRKIAKPQKNLLSIALPLSLKLKSTTCAPPASS